MSQATVTELHPDTGRDQHTEDWLTSLHIEWEYRDTVALDDVDQTGSLANQARLHVLDPDVVDRYTTDMARGDTFPPLLAQHRPRRKLLLLGGNHRYTAACNAKRTSLSMYVVTCEPEAATRLMYEDNRRHGLPPGDEERIAQAVHLIDIGWTLKAAAECVGVSTGKIGRARDVIAADRRARELEIEGWAALPKSSKWRLGSIRSDPVLKHAARVVAAAGLDSGAIFDLATHLNACRSEEEAFAFIGTKEDELRQQIQAKAGGNTERQPKTPRARMLTAIGQLGGCNPVDVAAGCANVDQAKSLARELDDVRKRLDATIVAIKKRWM